MCYVTLDTTIQVNKLVQVGHVAVETCICSIGGFYLNVCLGK